MLNSKTDASGGQKYGIRPLLGRTQPLSAQTLAHLGCAVYRGGIGGLASHFLYRLHTSCLGCATTRRLTDSALAWPDFRRASMRVHRLSYGARTQLNAKKIEIITSREAANCLGLEPNSKPRKGEKRSMPRM